MTPSTTPFVFIMGNARTGSNAWRAILRKHPDLFIAQEFRLHMPLRPDFLAWFATLGDLTQPENRTKLFLALYDQENHAPKQQFWTGFWSNIARWLPRETLEATFSQTDNTAPAFIAAVLRGCQQQLATPLVGAKNPAHISFLPHLKKWFPDSKFIHLIRDPRAIYLSQCHKKHKDLNVPISVNNIFWQLFIIGTTTIEWWWSFLVYWRQRHHPNYRMVRFEDFVANPEAQISSICTFLGIDYQPQMTAIPVKASSFAPQTDAQQSGIQGSVAHRWHDHLSPLTKSWFALICWPGLKHLGY